jgi:preprotein translocase subunit YajC
MVAIFRYVGLASLVLGVIALPARAQWSADAARQVAQADADSGPEADAAIEEAPDEGAEEGAAEDGEAASGADEAVAKGAAKKKKQPTILESLISSPLFIFLPLGILFYFLMIRPQQKRSAEMANMMKNLKKGDRVVTVGGIVGLVVNAQKDSDQVTLLIDEGSGAKLRVMRSHLSKMVTDSDKGSDKSRSDKESAADLAGGDKSYK